jgi:acyl-CoA-binding protein
MIKRFARSEHTTRFMSIDEFDDAAAYLSGSTINIADGVKLQFYALFKQASIGPCNVDRPSFFDFVGKAKWDAWHELGALPAADAKQRYVDLLTQIVPDWQRRATAVRDHDVSKACVDLFSLQLCCAG